MRGSVLSAFDVHVKSLRADAARERLGQRATKSEARLEELERQTISVWRVQNGHPIEVIYQR